MSSSAPRPALNDTECDTSESRHKAHDFRTVQRRGQNIVPAIFIHSSWRTSSTWLWQKFRRITDTICYYEPFNEGLATITRDHALEHGPHSWNSGHAKGGPYLLEYAPLLRKSGGVRTYQREMAYEWYLPPDGLNGDLRSQEAKYLSLLLRHAARLGRTPVFGFSRSLGRLSAIKKQFRGTHIFLHRNLWRQWMSYSWQKSAGNPYFYNTMFRLSYQRQDFFMIYLYNYYLTRAIKRYLSKKPAAPIDPQSPDLQFQIFGFLPDHDAFAMFMALHVYLYLHAQQQADIVVDVTRMAADDGYRASIVEEVHVRTDLTIELSDISDHQQFCCCNVDSIDWQEIDDNAALAVRALSDFYPREKLRQNASDIVAATHAEMLLAERYLRGARRQITDLLTENRKLSDEHSLLTSELHEVNQALEASFAANERTSQERDALSGQLNQILQERDAAVAERDELARHREALVADRTEILAQHNAVLAERDDLSRQREAIANNCTIISAEGDRALAQRDRLVTERDMLAAERDRIGTESWRWFEATIGVGAAEAANSSGAAVRDGTRKNLGRSSLRHLSGIWQWRRVKKSIAAARRASAARRWEIAARHYCDALDSAPHRAPLWVQYGHALKEAGKLQAGEYAYRRSLECNDQVADTHLQLAHLLGLQKRSGEAAQSYLRALRIAPHLHDAIYGLLALGWTADAIGSEAKCSGGSRARPIRAPRNWWPRRGAPLR